MTASDQFKKAIEVLFCDKTIIDKFYQNHYQSFNLVYLDDEEWDLFDAFMTGTSFGPGPALEGFTKPTKAEFDWWIGLENKASAGYIDYSHETLKTWPGMDVKMRKMMLQHLVDGTAAAMLQEDDPTVTKKLTADGEVSSSLKCCKCWIQQLGFRIFHFVEKDGKLKLRFLIQARVPSPLGLRPEAPLLFLTHVTSLVLLLLP